MRIFGEIKGIDQGELFESRIALAKAGIHPPIQKGISGSQIEGADSIVLSGGYEDDQDYGDEIIYTGSGGRDPNSKAQVRDQKLSRDNLALARSKMDCLPVRVTRGHTHKSPYSPKAGYIYSGIFYVEDYWREKGKAGFDVWRFRLVGNSNIQISTVHKTQQDKHTQALRREGVSSRIIRDRKLADQVKQLYRYSCQVCGVVLKTSAGEYAEAAHIKPLGNPHNGPDVMANLLCLCPNHHVLFDNGGFSINDDLSLSGLDEELKNTMSI